MRNSLRFWRTFSIAWVIGVVYFTSQDYAYLPVERSHWLKLLSMNALQITAWGLLVLPALSFMRRWPLDGANRLRNWSLFAPLTLLLVFLGLWIAFEISWVQSGMPFLSGPTHHARLIRFYTLYFHFYFLTFLSVLFAYHAYLWRKRFRDGELRASLVEAKLVQAQNQALRMQLQPHFLFNTLHSISTLMHSDVESADLMITRLGDLLRLSLDRNGEQEITLAQELDFLSAYLEIERIRFKDRLQVILDVPAQLKDAQLPTFILQPLVENALKHGFSKRSGSGTVIVRAREAAGELKIEVEDDGAGLSDPRQEGVGLRSVRERLALLYGDASQFSLNGLPGRGALAALALPLKRQGPPQHGSHS